MVDNDNACFLAKRSAFASIASKLAPTDNEQMKKGPGRGTHFYFLAANLW
jgi:hypothetical protein